MADKRIQDLTAAVSVALTDLFEISQGGVASRKATGSQIQTSFTGKQDALGFTPENVANKSIDGTLAANSDTLYSSQKAVKTYVDNSVAATAPFVDTTSIVKGSADGTKQLRFEVDGFTAGATRIATPPNQNFTMAGIDVANVFSSGQTFTPATNTIALNITGVTVTAASSQTFSRIVGTWNTTGTPAAMLINITDTASNAASTFIECQISGNQVFSIGKTGSLNFVYNVRQTFNPGANNSGLNVGSVAGDPGTLVNGDLWYESGANELHARINGVTVALGAGGGGSPPFTDATAIIKGSADATKLLRIEVDGFTAATTRVATPPNQDFTIAGLEVQQTFTKRQTITPPVDTAGLVISGASITGADFSNILDLAGTWNTTGAPRGIKLNITHVASDAASQLLDLQVGGNTMFGVDVTGFAAISGGILSGASITINPGTLNITPVVNTSALIVSGYSLTGANTQPVFNLSGTWNTSGAPTGISLNITNTASSVSSRLIDLRVGGITFFNVDRLGNLETASGINAAVGNFTVASDGSFQAAGGPFAVDVSSNLTINSILTFNSSGLTLTDNGAGLLISSNAISLNNNLINDVAEPVSPSDAATKNYVDSVASLSGSGSPEGSVTASVGKSYLDISNTDNPGLWYKATGSGNTGWRNLIAAG